MPHMGLFRNMLFFLLRAVTEDDEKLNENDKKIHVK